MKTTMNTGALELRGLYQRYVTEGLMLAGLFHIALIGGYQLYANISGEEIKFDPIITRDPVYLIPQPPSYEGRPVMPNVAIQTNHPSPFARPIPIPDAEINPESTIASQQEIKDLFAAGNIGEPGEGSVFIFENTKIEDEAPPIFQPIEKQPIAIRVIQPPYPAIPLKAGVEGTVLVNMWVTKEGKVKKAEIAKTTNELFNQAALDAAEQWVFTPAIMNNGPVSVWVTVPFKFKLNNRN